MHGVDRRMTSRPPALRPGLRFGGYDVPSLVAPWFADSFSQRNRMKCAAVRAYCREMRACSRSDMLACPPSTLRSVCNPKRNSRSTELVTPLSDKKARTGPGSAVRGRFLPSAFDCAVPPVPGKVVLVGKGEIVVDLLGLFETKLLIQRREGPPLLLHVEDILFSTHDPPITPIVAIKREACDQTINRA